jgi:hypothetical protein
MSVSPTRQANNGLLLARRSGDWWWEALDWLTVVPPDAIERQALPEAVR